MDWNASPPRKKVSEAHNVLVAMFQVNGVLVARIRVLRNKYQVCRGNGAQRNDLAVAESDPPTGGEAQAGLSGDVLSIFLFVISGNNDNAAGRSCYILQFCVHIIFILF
jgi:hypothetical protein